MKELKQGDEICGYITLRYGDPGVLIPDKFYPTMQGLQEALDDDNNVAGYISAVITVRGIFVKKCCAVGKIVVTET